MCVAEYKANHHWRWGKCNPERPGLKSESLAGQSPEFQSHRVHKETLFERGQISSAKSPETSNLRVQDPVLKSPVSKIVTNFFLYFWFNTI